MTDANIIIGLLKSLDINLVIGLSFIAAFAVTFYSVPIVARKLLAAGITGKDINKSGAPVIPEMGGVAIVMGLVAGVLFTTGALVFLGIDFNPTLVFAGLSTILIMALIGIYDDLFDMAQLTKALLPVVAAVPLIAATIGSSRAITLPFIGPVEFGLLYPLILIPLAITVTSNLTNMLAGFNGLEAGMGAMIFISASIIAYMHGNSSILIFTVPMAGALLAFLFFNRYPAKVFIGDIGTLTIGATLATAVIVGGFQSLGAVLVVLYVIDFFIKAYNKFPTRQWWGENRNGKLYPVEGKVRGLCQLIMKAANGISEQNLVLVLIGLQALVGIAAFVLFIIIKR